MNRIFDFCLAAVAYPFAITGLTVGFVFQAFIGGIEEGREVLR